MNTKTLTIIVSLLFAWTIYADFVSNPQSFAKVEDFIKADSTVIKLDSTVIKLDSTVTKIDTTFFKNDKFIDSYARTNRDAIVVLVEKAGMTIEELADILKKKQEAKAKK